MGKKTKRLVDKIVDIFLNTGSAAVSRTLKDGIADVGESTICNLLKKDMTVPEKEFVTKVLRKKRKIHIMLDGGKISSSQRRHPAMTENP